MNPYRAPKPLADGSLSVPRFRLLAALLAIFVADMTTTELVPQLINVVRLGRFQNPFGLFLGTAIFGLVAYATFVEWRGKVATLRTIVAVCAVLIPITALVTARFIWHFMPLLNIESIGVYRGIIFGQVFCIVVWVYSAKVLSRRACIRQERGLSVSTMLLVPGLLSLAFYWLLNGLALCCGKASHAVHRSTRSDDY